jgi:hypothetical protein
MLFLLMRAANNVQMSRKIKERINVAILYLLSRSKFDSSICLTAPVKTGNMIRALEFR